MSNVSKDIRKQLFAYRQKLIKVCGDLKKAQNDLIVSINECALAEICHYNALKCGVIKLNMKNAIKHYFKVYGDKFIIEEQIMELEKSKEIK